MGDDPHWGEKGHLQRGEIWYVNLNPAKGHEIRKTRPAVIVSSDGVGVLRLKLVIPITGWSKSYEEKLWIVRIDPTQRNGLIKPSGADALQTRSVAFERFTTKIGVLERDTLEQIVAALAIVVEFV